jgi:hypothetical protein
MTNVELTREDLIAYYIEMTKETMPQLATTTHKIQDAANPTLHPACVAP